MDENEDEDRKKFEKKKKFEAIISVQLLLLPCSH